MNVVAIEPFISGRLVFILPLPLRNLLVFQTTLTQFGNLIVEELLIVGIWGNAVTSSSNCNGETEECGDGVLVGFVNTY